MRHDSPSHHHHHPPTHPSIHPSIHRWAVVSPPGDKRQRCSARRFVDKDALTCHKRPPAWTPVGASFRRTALG